MDTFSCHVCSAAAEELPDFKNLLRVTSDCRAWKRGGRLGVCSHCGVVQTPNDTKWQSEIKEIYASYKQHHQGLGNEQAIFDVNVSSSPRSESLARRLQTELVLSDRGRLLDVGCGRGLLLKAFSKILPDWDLCGVEIDNKFAELVRKIPGVSWFSTNAIDAPGKFDLVTLIHVLEHVTDPVSYLKKLVSKLGSGGRLIVELPWYQRNPFDLLVADHASHFCETTLAWVLAQAGLAVSSASNWVPKELSVAAGVDRDRAAKAPTANADANRHAVIGMIAWLERLLENARTFAAQDGIGVFGTSIAGSWLGAELGDKLAFFVDEDLSRAGSNFMNCPVYLPKDLPKGSHVYLPFAAPAGEVLAKRLSESRSDCSFLTPGPIS